MKMKIKPFFDFLLFFVIGSVTFMIIAYLYSKHVLLCSSDHGNMPFLYLPDGTYTYIICENFHYPNLAEYSDALLHAQHFNFTKGAGYKVLLWIEQLLTG